MVTDHAQRLSLQTMITPDLSGRLFVTKSLRTFRKPKKVRELVRDVAAD